MSVHDTVLPKTHLHASAEHDIIEALLHELRIGIEPFASTLAPGAPGASAVDAAIRTLDAHVERRWTTLGGEFEMTWQERVYFCVRWLDTQVHCNGLNGWSCNVQWEREEATVRGLKRIGADETCCLAVRATRVRDREEDALRHHDSCSREYKRVARWAAARFAELDAAYGAGQAETTRLLACFACASVLHDPTTFPGLSSSLQATA